MFLPGGSIELHSSTRREDPSPTTSPRPPQRLLMDFLQLEQEVLVQEFHWAFEQSSLELA